MIEFFSIARLTRRRLAMLAGALVCFGWGPAAAAPFYAKQQMIAAAHPAAVRAGFSVLQEGGSAIDAMIAAQMVLNLVEPQSSGIGGGAFLLYWDSADKKLRSYDGRETAPQAAGEDLFAPGGKPMKSSDAVVGGRSVGVPGLVAMLELAHRRHGKLPWARLFEPAIALAENGFAVSPRMHRSIAEAEGQGLARYKQAREYFFTPAGDPLPIGTMLKNPQFAATLRAIAADPRALYEGAIANAIAAAVQTPDRPGLLTGDDLRNYQAVEREPICAPYRAYEVCAMGPPTSGGVGVLQILGMLERFDSASLAPDTPGGAHLFLQASRLAYADRGLYLADTDFVEVPVAGLLARDYLAGRAREIDPCRDLKKAPAGIPPGAKARTPASSLEQPSTTHLSIVDAAGDVASMTSSVESAFGSKVMARGFMLNNQLTDFSFRAADEHGALIANRVQPGKRPRSSMSPVIVLEGAKPVLALGSPGSSRIISYVARTIVAVLDGGLDIDAALRLAHVVNRNGKTEVEQGGGESLIAPLTALGHEIQIRQLTSGLHAVVIAPEGLYGAADPRREGIVLGE